MVNLHKKLDFGDFIIAIVFIASPVASIIFRTFRAIYSDYYQGLLTDPGHRWVAFFNHVLIVLVIAGVAALFGLNQNAESYFNGDAVLGVVFAQFSGWGSFAILYGLSLFIHLYGTHRDAIIRKINEHAKVW